MHEWLFGYDMFRWVQIWSHPALDVFFYSVTDLGASLLYYLIIAPLFWVVDRRRALVLFLLLLLSAFVNGEAKLLANTPRPDPNVIRVLDLRPLQAGSPAFPSGHAQIAMVFWGYLAYWAGRRWFTALCALLVAAISFSRIYLGAHFPIDVIAGLLIGAAFFAVVPALERWAAKDFPMPLAGRVLSAIAALLVMVGSTDPALVAIAGCLLAVFVLLSLPQARFALATPTQISAVVAAGLVLQIVCAALLGQLSGGGTANAGTGLRIAALWLIALWLYPHAVAAVAGREPALASDS